MKRQILVIVAMIAFMSSETDAQVASDDSPRIALSGQTKIATTMSDCDYNTCALRMKLSWGNWRIIQGEQERAVGTLGVFRAPRLESIVATSPEAVAEARVFQNNYTRGEIFQALGVVTMILSVAASSGNDSEAGPIAGVVGGSALLFYGVSLRVRAENALSKTIWLYNRSLKR